MTYKTIGVIGDSISNGYWDGDGKGGWFGRLAERLTQEQPGQFGFNNMAQEGDRVADVFHRFASEATSRSLDVIIIAVGCNGVIRSPEKNSPLDLSPHLRYEYWQKLLTLSNQNPATVVVLDILPVLEARYPSVGSGNVPCFECNDDVEAYNLQIEELCDQYKIHFFKRYDKWTQRDLSLYYIDTVHPNADGHQIIADEVYSFLKENKIIP